MDVRVLRVVAALLVVLLGDGVAVLARAAEPAPPAALAAAPVVDDRPPAGLDPAAFADPPNAVGPAVFWFLNDELEETELRRQLRAMRAAGVSQVILHARQGLGGEFGASEDRYYLSPAWFDAVGVAVDEARALDLRVWLYDELNWPPGQAGGRTIAGGEVDGVPVPPNPELIARYLQVRAVDVAGGTQYVAEVPRNAGEHVGTLAAPVTGAEPCADGDGPTGVRLDGERLVTLPTDGRTLTWDAPEGRWCVLHLVAHRLVGYRPEREPDRHYVDLLNPAVTEKLLATSYEPYRRRFGGDFGATIAGVYNDEPGLYANFGDGRAGPASEGGVPWTPGFGDWLAERDVGLRDLAALWFDVGARTTATRTGFYTALQDRYVEAYLRPLHDWAEAHDLALVANPLVEENLGDHKLVQGGSLLRMLRWYQVPGMDVIGGLDVDAVTPKLVSSAAHLFGRERTLAESFGAFGFDLTVEEMKRVVAWEAAGGVDLLNVHAFAYSVRDQRALDAPPNLFFQSSGWATFPAFAQYAARLLAPAVGAAPVAQVAVMYPTATLLAEGTPRTNRGSAGNGPGLAEVDASWREASLALLRSQLDFDYVDELALAGGLDVDVAVGDGLLRAGSIAASVLVLPRTTTLSLEALGTLEAFVAAGGAVVAVEALPEREARGRDAELQARLAELFGAPTAVFLPDAAALAETVRGLVRADVLLAPAAPQVRVRHVRAGDDHAYLVVNLGDETVVTDASVAQAGAPELWGPETGATDPAPVWRREAGRVVVPLSLDPFEAVWVVFRQGARAGPHVTAADVAVEEVRAAAGGGLVATVVAGARGTYTVDGQQVSVDGPLEPVPLDGDWTLTVDGQAVTRPVTSWTDLAPDFSGEASYATAVDVAPAFLAPGRRIVLDLGAVAQTATVTVNGVEVGSRLWQPYVVDVTDALVSGRNLISVAVRNTEENALGRRTDPSGLFGPVALRPQAVVDVTLKHSSR
jgi:hypothetical protein